MGRFSPSTSTGHRIRRIGSDWYRLSWTVDFYYPTSRLRHPRGFHRDTDEAGGYCLSFPNRPVDKHGAWRREPLSSAPWTRRPLMRSSGAWTS